MAFTDILLHIQGYPEETSLDAIDDAVRLAGRLGATMTALATPVRISFQPNWLAERLVGLTDLAREAEQRCAATCKERLDRFVSLAARRGVAAVASTVVEEVSGIPTLFSQIASGYDFCVHIPPARGLDKILVEAVIFQSGRPVLILPAGSPTDFDSVAVAWDGGGAAARALNDSLPLLRAAKTVEVILAEEDKPRRQDALQQALRHLERHGVAAKPRMLAAKGRPAAVVLQHYLETQTPDLLVMGAYGHSRLREMVLGGVTDHMLSDPRTPVWFSH